MHIPNRFIDIEATNRCNATCNFCPRESTPKQGFMSMENFQQAVKRVLELGDLSQVKTSITGRGEPTLHPQIVDFVRILSKNGIEPAMTSNGSRLTPALSQQLLDAGLKKMVFSVSDLDDNYREIYGLDFAVVLEKIEHFIQIAEGKCHIQITVVRHRWNEETVDQTIEFWKNKKVDHVMVTREENRAGLMESIFEFEDKQHHRQKAIQLLNERGLSNICSSPFFTVFFGWEGNYNLCCQDWQKTVSLGNIHDLSIEEVDQVKLDFVEADSGVCKNCSVNPINDVQELLYEIDLGKRGGFAIANKMKNLNSGKQYQKQMKNILDEMNYHPKIISKTI